MLATDVTCELRISMAMLRQTLFGSIPSMALPWSGLTTTSTKDSQAGVARCLMYVFSGLGSSPAFLNQQYVLGRSVSDKNANSQFPQPKNVAPGVGFSGANVHFARIHIAHGRADYVTVAPGTGAAYVWKNICDKVIPADTAVSDSASGGNEPDTPKDCGGPSENPSPDDNLEDSDGDNPDGASSAGGNSRIHLHLVFTGLRVRSDILR